MRTQRTNVHLRALRSCTSALALALAAISCSSDHHESEDGTSTKQPLQGGTVDPIDRLPVVDSMKAVETFLEKLPTPTAAGENVAIHLKLPPPQNAQLNGSLVRVLGEPSAPLVVWNSDMLARIGQIRKSPGAQFFTAFLKLDEAEIQRRLDTEKSVGTTNSPSSRTLIFRGRTPIAITTGVRFDAATFFNGGLVALGPCPIKPASVLARWNESLLITNTAVVRDTSRTNDACFGGGNPNGVWTFKHLMAEMANGSGLSTHDFVLRWLSMWLNPYVVNGDTLPARTQMFNQVIKPWATASGVVATLSVVGSTNVLSLSGPLNLNIAPFRLSAIVNRIDLGATVNGPSGYGGGTTSEPLDAGELRFVFGVQNLSTCSVLPFSVITEYGVPITGCDAVRNWAIKWTQLNNPAFAAPFSAAWRAHLESLTESVVLHGAAPAKGNQNAINQVRTNEIALSSPWELREFTLTNENPMANTNPPINGPLRAHTVALTPNDTVFSPTPNAVTDQFVLNTVLPTVPPVVPTLPADCSASYSMPGWFLGGPFRGGNAFTAPPTHWNAALGVLDNRKICARHEFSLNTCNGCHFGDTSTAFLHVNPQVMPATLSNFLTGGGGVWVVPDSQFGAPNWTFADLARRYDRLYKIACTTCGSRHGTAASFVDRVAQLNRVVPIDPIGPTSTQFGIGPVTDQAIFTRLLQERASFVDLKTSESVELDGFVRRVETFVH